MPGSVGSGPVRVVRPRDAQARHRRSWHVTDPEENRCPAGRRLDDGPSDVHIRRPRRPAGTVVEGGQAPCGRSGFGGGNAGGCCGVRCVGVSAPPAGYGGFPAAARGGAGGVVPGEPKP